MTASIDLVKFGLRDAVVGLLRARLECGRAAAAETVLAAWLAGVAAADLEAAEPQLLYGRVVGLLAFARDRKPLVAKVRVYDPDPERDGWVSRHSVVEVVNDDMPFLVDSVAAELARLGIAVHQLVHPVVAARRDQAGRLEQMLPANRQAGATESLMHVEIDRQDPTGHAAIAARLEAVLADVRAAVEDWGAMRARIQAVAAELAATGAADGAEEDAAFLRWLHDGNFTFLGCRRFAFTGADGAVEVRVDGTGLGLLRHIDARVFDQSTALADMSSEVHAFLRRPGLLLVTKSARQSSVHRPVHMDVVGVKRFDASGRVVGLDAFLGLFTSAAYTMAPAQIPLLRRKVERTLARAGFPAFGHDARALGHILETYPRDELLQVSDDRLFDTALGILRLIERPRVALFVRRDEFEQFVSCLVFVPRDRYDTPLRLTVQGLLEAAYGGRVGWYSTQVADQPLARLHLTIRTTPGAAPAVDERELEARIAEAARSWSDHLQVALVQTHGEAAGLRLARRYAQAFPASYRERHPVLAAVADIDRVEQVSDGDDIALTLARPVEAGEHQARIKLYHRLATVALSDVLPLLEAMGLKVIAEVPHDIRPADGRPAVWIHDFEVESADGAAMDLDARRAPFEEALARVWRGEAESDGFNRLVLRAGLDWRQVAVLRAYAKYLRQAGSTYSQAYIERAVGDNPAVAASLAALFGARFDPTGGGACAEADCGAEAALAGVASADDDRILRRFLNLIRATLRTNYFQTGADGRP